MGRCSDRSSIETLCCPTCRAPFEQTHLSNDSSGLVAWLERWIANIGVHCIFSPVDTFNDDPLPTHHAARAFGLRCECTGSVADYKEHLRVCCPVAAKLQMLHTRCK